MNEADMSEKNVKKRGRKGGGTLQHGLSQAKAVLPHRSPSDRLHFAFGRDAFICELRRRQTAKLEEEEFKGRAAAQRNVNEPNKAVHASVGLF